MKFIFLTTLLFALSLHPVAVAPSSPVADPLESMHWLAAHSQEMVAIADAAMAQLDKLPGELQHNPIREYVAHVRQVYLDIAASVPGLHSSIERLEQIVNDARHATECPMQTTPSDSPLRTLDR
jgi:hypothetical protein